MENKHRLLKPVNSELDKLLEASLIKANDKYKVPPQIIWIDNSTVATLGNFSASTGKAKSKKTFNVSALVAASLSNGNVLQYRACLPENKRKILYVDTEQSRFHCHCVMQRILRLAGLPEDNDSENLVFFGLREHDPALRMKLIEYALHKDKGYGLVIIDGIRDLMLDINNPGESVTVINKLMQWSSQFNLHIHCVLHLNKGDDNIRGHIGTELTNKAETVLVISKNKIDANISEVKALNIRDKDFKPFAFKINENGMPIGTEAVFDEQDVLKSKKYPLSNLTEEEHLQAIKVAFAKKEISGYENMILALTDGYTSIGFVRGRTVMTRVLSFLIEKGWIKKENNIFRSIRSKDSDN